MRVLTRRLACLFLATTATCGWSLDVGDPIPWFTSTKVLQHGPNLEMPFALERYRGGAIFLVIWDENGGQGKQKKKIHEQLAEMMLEYGDQGLLVLGGAVDESAILHGLGDFGQRGPIVVISPEVYETFQPIEPLHPRRFLIAPDGTLTASDVYEKTKDEIAQALANRTPYGRWATLRKPWFPLMSTVAKAKALQEQVHIGGIGSAMAKARRYIEDGKDVPLANESRFVVEVCEKWIAQALEIEAQALAVGDPYTASLVDASLAESLRGVDEADAAKARLKIATSDPGYRDGKAFHALWQKTWTMSAEAKAKTLRSYADKNADSYYGKLAASWVGDG
jgi:hypothetical protein